MEGVFVNERFDAFFKELQIVCKKFESICKQHDAIKGVRIEVSNGRVRSFTDVGEFR